MQEYGDTTYQQFELFNFRDENAIVSQQEHQFSLGAFNILFDPFIDDATS